MRLIGSILLYFGLYVAVVMVLFGACLAYLMMPWVADRDKTRKKLP